ncbi:MAG: hypothetical protein IJA34_02650 [Lachnospiraceae bacterium]|nr:hypothetical protein [Lachnospiraceae bacterium]
MANAKLLYDRKQEIRYRNSIVLLTEKSKKVESRRIGLRRRKTGIFLVVSNKGKVKQYGMYTKTTDRFVRKFGVFVEEQRK